MSPLSVTTGEEGVGAGVTTRVGAGSGVDTTSGVATSTAASTLGAGEDFPPCIL